MDNECFKVEREGHIVWVVLSRPEKRNTMTLDFFRELPVLFQNIDEDPEVRVVIIKAEGKSFTAGLDLQEGATLLQGGAADAREVLRKKIMELQDSMTAVERCRKPVVAAIHGHCIGGGIDLTSACDIRIATRDAVFSIRETKMAMVADLGTLQRLPAIIGQGWFRELALTGRDFSAKEALNMGFVTRVCPDREDLYAEARKLAGEVAANSPLAVQGTKDTILYSRDNGIASGLRYVAQKNASLLPCEDLMEAFQAFMEKRAPHFKGR